MRRGAGREEDWQQEGPWLAPDAPPPVDGLVVLEHSLEHRRGQENGVDGIAGGAGLHVVHATGEGLRPQKAVHEPLLVPGMTLSFLDVAHHREEVGRSEGGKSTLRRARLVW